MPKSIAIVAIAVASTFMVGCAENPSISEMNYQRSAPRAVVSKGQAEQYDRQRDQQVKEEEFADRNRQRNIQSVQDTFGAVETGLRQVQDIFGEVHSLKTF
ncbi:MAG: hypothetical protein QM796_20435 [Chthoniobacteraceae bacterium]